MRQLMLSGALVASIAVASCDYNQNNAGASPTPGPLQTPTPSINPNPNFQQTPRPSCQSPLPNFEYLDAANNYAPLDSQEDDAYFGNDTIAYWSGSFNAFGLPNYTFVKPRVPVIAIGLTLKKSDSASLEIVPNDANQYPQQLLRHYKYTADLDAADRAARAAGSPLPTIATSDPKTHDSQGNAIAPATLSPSEVDAQFVKNVLPNLQYVDWGGSFDDSMFINDSGNPDGAEPHNYGMLCEYVQEGHYTLILHKLTTVQATDSTYNSTVGILNANGAPSAAADTVNNQPQESIITYADLPNLDTDDPSKVSDQTQRETVYNDMVSHYSSVQFQKWTVQVMGPYPSSPPSPTPSPTIVASPGGP